MRKSFLEVFPTLSLEEGKREICRGLYVEKAFTDKMHTYLRFAVQADNLVPRKEIVYLQTEIKEQLFPDTQIRIQIDEKYDLGKKYSVEEIFRQYYESIKEKLREKSMLLYVLFKNADYSFENGKMYMCLDENAFMQKIENELVSCLIGIFKEKFQIELSVEISYRKKAPKNHEEDIWNAQTVAIQEKTTESQQFAQNDSKSSVTVTKRNRSVEKKKKNHNTGNVIWGRDFDEREIIPIQTIQEDIGEVTIQGQIFDCETREIRNEKTLIMFSITDFTDSIRVKMFVKNNQLTEVLDGVQNKQFIILKGSTQFDRFDHELAVGSMFGIKKGKDFRNSRVDNETLKRVELHCHTKMSEMDGVSTAEDIIKQAYSWGRRRLPLPIMGVCRLSPRRCML